MYASSSLTILGYEFHGWGSAQRFVVPEIHGYKFLLASMQTT